MKSILQTLASVLLALHLLAVFLAPASVPPSSPAIQTSWSLVSPYLHSANLNHGYHFFAPEPGASTLLEYLGETSDGQQRRGIYPDKQMHRPRLHYHRYFMLTEFLGTMPEQSPLRQRIIQVYAMQILKSKNLDKVELRLVRHRPSSRQEVLIGERLDAVQTYERVNLGVFQWSEPQQPESSNGI